MKKNSRPNPLPLKETEKFELPEQFLNQLNEFTQGYVLIYVNESGTPDIVSDGDSEIMRLGLQKFALEYFQSLDRAFKNDVFSYVSDDTSS